MDLATRIAERLYDDAVALEWIPSDEADVFRLTFSSGRRPRYLKIPTAGIGAVWREVAMLPALRARGFPVLPFEHATADVPDAGVEFHVTEEVEHVPGADLAATNAAAACRLAEDLGRVVRRLEGLDPREIPGSTRWNRRRSVWWRPQYRALLRDGRWPAFAHQWAARVLAQLDTPARAFGGWQGELLIRPDGSYAMIDWTTGGASWEGAQAATIIEVLAGFDGRRGDLVGHFLRGYAPTGLRPAELERMRLWAVHLRLGWAMLQPLTAAQVAVAASHADRCIVSDDPADWFRSPGPPR